MRDYTVFDEKTGRPLRFGKCPVAVLHAQAGAGEVAEEGDWRADYFRDPNTGILALRAVLTASADRLSILVGEAVTVSGLPTNCTPTVDGRPVSVTDGCLTVEPTTPGTYVIRIDLPEYQPLRWRIEVSA